MPIFLISDLVVGVDTEAGQVMSNAEEQYELHVEEKVAHLWRRSEDSLYRAEDGTDSKNGKGFKAEYVSEYEAGDDSANPEHND